ncbi:MAG TPA: OsmC family protein [Micromonosporaceae bacterium]
MLHALAACLTAGLATIAAARGIQLTEVRSTVSGDIDLDGILGLDPTSATATRTSPRGSRSRATPRPRSSGSSWPGEPQPRPRSRRSCCCATSGRVRLRQAGRRSRRAAAEGLGAVAPRWACRGSA